MFQDRGTISSDCLLVGLARGSCVIRMSTKGHYSNRWSPAAEFQILWALCAWSAGQDTSSPGCWNRRAAGTAHPCTESPASWKCWVYHSICGIFQGTCSWVDLLQQVWCRWWHSSKQSGAQSRGLLSCNWAHCTFDGADIREKVEAVMKKVEACISETVRLVHLLAASINFRL